MGNIKRDTDLASRRGKLYPPTNAREMQIFF